MDVLGLTWQLIDLWDALAFEKSTIMGSSFLQALGDTGGRASWGTKCHRAFLDSGIMKDKRNSVKIDEF